MPRKLDEYKHVNYSWDDSVADELSPIENLVYRSNILAQISVLQIRVAVTLLQN